MSCHTYDGTLFICLSPIMGITSEEEWIIRELETIGHHGNRKRALKAKLSRLQSLQKTQDQQQLQNGGGK